MLDLSIPLNGDEVLIAGESTFKGRRYVSLRVWYANGTKPGKNGLNLPVEQVEAMLAGLRAIETWYGK